MRPQLWTAVRVVLFLAGLGIVVLLVVELDINQVLGLVARTGWGLGLILLVYGGCQATRAGALWLCQPLADRVPYRQVLGIRVAAEAVRLLTFTGPVLAEPSKVWLLGRRGLQTQAGIAAIVAELVAHSLIATTLSIPALTYLVTRFEVSPAVRTAVVVLICVMAAYVVVAVVAIWRRVYLIGAGARLLRRAGLLGFVRDPGDVRRMEDMLLGVFHERPARLGLMLSFQVAANLLLVLEILVALQAMGFAAPPHYPLVIEGTLKLVSIVFFFIPAQVGVSEGVYALVFDTLGLPAAAGVSLAFIRRLRTLTVAAVGFVAAVRLSAR